MKTIQKVMVVNKEEVTGEIVVNELVTDQIWGLCNMAFESIAMPDD